MKKCKNESCNIEIPNNRIYCSQSCRSIWNNKNTKNYKKVSNTFKEKHEFKKKKYYEDPKRCKYCNEIIPYENRRNKFCNISCSASYSNKNRNVDNRKFSNEGMQNILKSNKKKLQDRIELYNKNPKKCSLCNKIISYENRKLKFCSKICYKKDRKKNFIFSNMNKSELNNYKFYKKLCQFNFNIFNFPNEFNLDLIKEFGMYKAKNRGDNLNGISRDHKFSIMDGYENNILPFYISHPANCELMNHPKNSSKNRNSSITLEELIKNIEKWNEKYGPMV